MDTKLPVSEVIPEIRNTLVSGKTGVIQAPPGAGKTTMVPLALMNEPWLAGRKIVMLEPRRLAARAAAERMSSILGTPLGETVGYHIRMERKCSPATRIEVVTEGILTRRIQRDPSLEDTGLIIFDEFHERNLNSDLGLALCLEIMGVFRDDLRVLVMSATLDAEPVAEIMGGAPVISSQGRSWPVSTRYITSAKAELRGNPRGFDARTMEQRCIKALKMAITGDEGDILVFLPGAGEIRRVAERASGEGFPSDVYFVPLYGNLSKKDQDLAIRPSKKGQRKVVLATSIAETSLTIEGVHVVIDSGLMRVPKFNPGTGMSRLVTLPASKASADQRRGRAGRTGPGVCYRLWSEAEHAVRVQFSSPEILNADLADLALELSMWGAPDPGQLSWLDTPPAGAFSQARDLLTMLGAMDFEGKITPHGKEMAKLGIHPRLAHMMIMGKNKGAGSLACKIAALLSERDFLFFDRGSRDSDIRLRLEFMCGRSSARNASVNRGLLSRICKSAGALEKRLRVSSEDADLSMTGSLLAQAYPDRVSCARAPGSPEFKTTSGSGVFFSPEDNLIGERWIVAADLDGNRKNARVHLAAPYSEDSLFRDFEDKLERHTVVEWDRDSCRVISREDVQLGALVVETSPLRDPDPEALEHALAEGLRDMGISSLPWNKDLLRFRDRANFLREEGGFDLPDMSQEGLLNRLEDWFLPFAQGISSRAHFSRFDLKSALHSMFSWDDMRLLDTMAPTHVTVPSGSKIPLDYGACENGKPPVLAVRLQEMFGLLETPRVAGGKIPVLLHLLSPAQRPMQVTRDLESFWKNTYADVKKDLAGRYPKHYWPDDPMNARATGRTKPRK